MEQETGLRQRDHAPIIALNDSQFRYVTLTAVLLALPLTLNNYAAGYLVSAAVGAVIVLLLSANLLLNSWIRHPLLRRDVFICLLAVGCLLAVSERGAIVLYWAYPIVVVFHFMLDRRPAIAINALFLFAVSLLAFGMLDVQEFGRFFASLAMCSLFASFFSSSLMRHREALEQQIMTDSLTGAFNRRHLDARLPGFVEQKSRYGHAATMVLFDLDHFKRINDEWGHEAGDRVLRTVVDTVRGRVRAMDEIYRYGGDEFVVILPDTTLAPAAKLAQDIIDIVSVLHIIRGGDVTLSIGVAELMADESPRSWLRRCDLAAYEAKHRGRNRICVATDTPPLGIADDEDLTESRITYLHE